MSALMLDSAARRQLRARAHALQPVVMIASKGLTPAVLAEIDRALTAHELIKIRVTGAERQLRTAYLDAICTTLACAPVQMLGNLLIVWRPRPAQPEKDPVTTGATARDQRQRAKAATRRAALPNTTAVPATLLARARKKKAHS